MTPASLPTFLDTAQASSPERTLWLAVLAQLVRDLCGDDESAERRAGLRYLGGAPSRHFREVCDLAGVDPVKAHAGLLTLARMPFGERQARHRISRLRRVRDVSAA